ncbi:MBL fold metallo-hydrolase [Roseospira visakhapatnamensis]|uniref:7, 8-dihydropterin-6-yl-methyl-4-(Beta-D-ribofuranosyl)aminobenzene 5'-phosphate synthase n=1 Tax=Roseospira visakhapatnamensis TaxID=390880 RepID=A0A7W6RA92_9PROT|nr:MBL fold metallo-hydrolase [Roseospira visakhapatnamensis]MBB4264788.1 7,8-dihydropterin-6-yl-methyl-4-(beta-D-ribofuranosyl)aminobenzene 5'-phosphate synthase [Roseospira visakhapatnamensis]
MLRITTVVENSPGELKSLLHEHGLSFHIDTGAHSLLFDTGQGDALVPNARHLRIDLSSVTRVVLSHGHYDHTGGLRAFAAQSPQFELVTGPGCLDDKYAEVGAACEFLGNDFDADWLAENGIDHVTLNEPIRELVPGVHALTDFPRVHPDEVINPRFKVLRDGKLVTDDFADEVMLAVDMPEGLIAILGCSHPGVKNMLDAATQRLGKPIHTVIGGTHMVEASPESIALTAAYLREKEISVIGMSHCTGKAAMETLSAMDSGYYHNRTGTALFIN